jgi:hypothetical protein
LVRLGERSIHLCAMHPALSNQIEMVAYPLCSTGARAEGGWRTIAAVLWEAVGCFMRSMNGLSVDSDSDSE